MPTGTLLLVVGAEKFMLIRFDENGKFESVGSTPPVAEERAVYLDQQAFRLNLSGIEELL